MTRVLSVLVGLMVSATAMADGFQSGSSFQTVNLFGSLTVQCNEPGVGTGSDVISCFKTTVLPTEQDYFVSTSETHAKYIRLTVGTKTVTARYFQAKQRTRDEITLLASSGGILSQGTNVVTVEYLNPQNEVVETSTFTVDVTSGGSKTCQSRTVQSPTLSDCQGGGQRLCNAYFENENFCNY